MTDQNNAAQPGLTDDEIRDIITDAHQAYGAFKTGYGLALGRAIESALLTKLRAEGVQAGDTLTQVYDAFGIGVLARSPSTLLACLGNVIRRANCLSQVEQVLSVPTPPEPEDDGVWGEESLLRWGEDEKGYAEHFKAAMAEWSRRAALASAPVAGEAQKPFAVLAVHKNGEIRSFCTGQAVADAPIQESERDLQRKYGYELVTVYAAPQASEAMRILFPTHLRKMWSGGEVQGWLDEHQGITPPKASARGSMERYRKWQADQAQADKDGGDCGKGAQKGEQ